MPNAGCTLWFTGLSGSGKTTLAIELEKELNNRGICSVQRLDGDIVREDLTRDLGFSKEDREENIRRVTFVAELLSKNGVFVLVSFISPYRKGREEARRRCKNFIEIYMRCDKEYLIKRDVKGLYKKAIAGEITDFTGINDPYEEPERPQLIIDSSKVTIDDSLQKILAYLEQNNILQPVR